MLGKSEVDEHFPGPTGQKTAFYLILFKFRLPLIFASRGAKIGMDEKLGLKIKGRREGGEI